MAEEIAEHGAAATRATLKPKAEDVFRSLWVSLFYSGRVSGKTVLICSAGRREGASTIAAGLAVSGAEPSGAARVALVDFNVRNPALHRILAANMGPGIGEVLREGNAPETVAQRINAGLDLYPVGSADGSFLDVFRGEGLERLFRTLADGYDHVIVDAAPANQFPDAQVLAGALKDVVLVARTENTPREAVAQAKKRIEAGGGTLAGLVLNLRTYPIPKFLYNRV
jgi:Mrp family chromosome partitioning ATPase